MQAKFCDIVITLNAQASHVLKFLILTLILDRSNVEIVEVGLQTGKVKTSDFLLEDK